LFPGERKDVHEAFLGLGAQGQQLYDQALLATKTALAMGITYAFVVGAAITLVALVVGIFLKEVPLRKTYAVAAEGAPAPDGASDHAPREPIVAAPAPSLAADPPPLEGDGPAGAAAGPTRPAEP
jgi:hypothetical protein